jgi:hypothetical protein
MRVVSGIRPALTARPVRPYTEAVLRIEVAARFGRAGGSLAPLT